MIKLNEDNEQTAKRRQLNRIVGLIVIIIIAGSVGASLMYLGVSAKQTDLKSKSCPTVLEAEKIVFENNGEELVEYSYPGQEKWDLTGKKLTPAELQERYMLLYNFTQPYIIREEIKAVAIPTGTPEIYGLELGVTFDGDSDKMITILRRYEDASLDEGQMKRYVDVGSRIACEYCCGVKTLVFKNGQRACGCAHSYAMRGLAKYLIINHPAEYTDDEILDELAKWKATYFPKQSIQKVLQKQVETGKVDLSVLAEMPAMVGNC